MPVGRSLLLTVGLVPVLIGACGQAGEVSSPADGSSSSVQAPPATTSRPAASGPGGADGASTPTPTGGSTSTTATDEPDGTAGSTRASTPDETALEPGVEGSSASSAPRLKPIVLSVRLDRRVDDAATEGFEAFVERVLTDERGWVRAAFEFTFDDPDAAYVIVLAEGDEVDRLCLPYDTFGRFSCQIGPVVALNADRWRSAVESWPASLDDYRTMLVNHEVGHLLGQHHPALRCPGEGELAPVMAQQSSGVAPCVPNPWPLPWELTCARQRVEPLAPPFERDITLTCGPDGPIG
ncbi:MAG: DUF3152 domain-containing protein [Acidimicrobiales bacterium]